MLSPRLNSYALVAGTDIEWMSDPNPCKSSTANFFPVTGGAELNEAIAVCVTCPNRKPCLQYALDNNIHDGIWGGQSERGRRRIAKALRRSAL